MHAGMCTCRKNVTATSVADVWHLQAKVRRGDAQSWQSGGVMTDLSTRPEVRGLTKSELTVIKAPGVAAREGRDGVAGGLAPAGRPARRSLAKEF